jgi:hypothetical protein
MALWFPSFKRQHLPPNAVLTLPFSTLPTSVANGARGARDQFANWY